MFVLEVEDEIYSLKPMNCPESTYVYKMRTRSYRDLPLRLAEIGSCLLYTSDAADDLIGVDLGGRRIIKN